MLSVCKRMRQAGKQIAGLLPLLLLLVLACFEGNAVVQLATPLKEGSAATGAPLAASPKEFGSFPSVTNSTIMFLHVFKCAGTSLRQVFMSLAEQEGWTGGIADEGCQIPQSSRRRLHSGDGWLQGHICLNVQNTLINRNTQKWQVAGMKVIAGHFMYDFHQYATPPQLLITTLRNPLELFVSSNQFKHREETKTLKAATEFVVFRMKERLRWRDPTDLAFIRRFLGTEAASSYRAQKVYTEEESLAMVSTAVEHLNTFWVVGVVEQYEGFIEVLKHALDPGFKHADVWESALTVKDNGSPVRSRDVLSSIDQDLVREFNATTLAFQWQVYDIALQLWDTRCREVLPHQDHDRLCSVPGYRRAFS